MKTIKLLVCLLAAMAANVTFATENTWRGPNDGDWNEPTNWSLGHVPTVGEDVIISGKTVTLTQSVEVASLTLASKATLNVIAPPLVDTSSFATSQAAASSMRGRRYL